MTIHLATSADLGRVVRRGLREPVGFVADNWLVGPCGSQPEEHAGARCGFWGLQGRERARLLGSLRGIREAIDSPSPIVVWMSRLGSDTVAFWAICAWRLLRWPEQPNVGLVVLGGPTEVEDATGVGGGSVHITPASARLRLDQIRSLSLTRVREAAVFWRKLCGRSPILADKGERAAAGREQLFELGDYQAGFFPRLDAGSLLLSRFDELLFSCLGKQSLTPVDVFMSRGPAGEELRRWLSFTGDVVLSLRLAQWARHDGEDAALMMEPCEAGNRMKAARYRLSTAGRTIQRKGLGEIARGAPLPVWGVTAYEPLAAWVVAGERAGRKYLQRFGEHSTQDVGR